MPAAESDVSILIPTYKYRDKVVRAVESALASGAGEIIVTDDAGHDGTIERLAQYTDPRLHVSENAHNLGLWENHLHALSLASRPWIKFIQADDYLLPGGLAAYAAAVQDGVSVVFGAPTVRDDASGEVSYHHLIASPRRASPAQLQVAFLFGGWILGSPSHMMLRADAIERDPAAWKTTISSDLVVGAIAAARGDTVLLPIGAIGQGSHPGQDARTQNAALGLERMVRSLSYLRQRQEPGLRWLANMWTWLQLRPELKTVARGLIRREASAGKLLGYPWRMLSSLSIADWREIQANRRLLRDAARFRATAKPPFDLAKLLEPGIARHVLPRRDAPRAA